MDPKKKKKLVKLSLALLIVAAFFSISLFFFRSEVKQDGVVKKPPLDTSVQVKTYEEGQWKYEGLREFGAWIWEPPVSFSEPQVEDMVSFAKAEGVTTLYINITDYADIFELADSAERKKQIASFTDGLKRFVSLANQQGIKVEALAGDPFWGYSSHWYLAEEVFRFVVEYNRTVSEGEHLAGIQFDIEPYDRTVFEQQNVSLAYTEYLMLARSIAERAQGTNMKVGFTTPFWYDDASPRAPQIKFNDKQKPVGQHLADILSTVPRSYIALLDYRKFAEGDNGAIAKALGEFNYIKDQHLPVAIVVGFEFVKQDPDVITFFGTSKGYFKGENEKVIKAFESYPAFAGTAVHDLKNYRDLAP